ncbi:MAG: FAD-dependent oxidoreductase [Candidatus Altiarchaeota archaeon]
METISEIVAIRKETYNVKTFRLKPEEIMEFVPGQYAFFSIQENKMFSNYTKPFSFSSSPTERNFFEITVKRVGVFTTEMHKLKKGDRMLVNGPHGDALIFDEKVKDDVVFIAGGSGITPFMSAIRYATEKKLKNKILLIFSNKTYDDIIYRKELSDIERRNPNIKIVNTLTDSWPKKWDGETGMITKELILRYAKEPENKIWYICGPPGMIISMKKILNTIKIPEANIRYGEG